MPTIGQHPNQLQTVWLSLTSLLHAQVSRQRPGLFYRASKAGATVMAPATYVVAASLEPCDAKGWLLPGKPCRQLLAAADCHMHVPHGNQEVASPTISRGLKRRLEVKSN